MPCWTLVLHSTSTCFASLHLPLTTATSRAVASLDFYKIFSRGIPKKKDKPCQEEEVKEVVAEEVAAEVVAAEVVAAACRRWTPSLIVLGTCCAERLQLPLYRTFFLLKYCIIKPPPSSQTCASYSISKTSFPFQRITGHHATGPTTPRLFTGRYDTVASAQSNRKRVRIQCIVCSRMNMLLAPRA